MNGPTTWTQPLFGADAVPHLIINGTDIDLDFAEFSASLTDPQGVAVETAGGQHVPHVLLESAEAPLSLGTWEVEVSWQQVSEDVRRLALTAPALARSGVLIAYLDRTIYDVWQGDAVLTTFVLSRSTGYGTTGVLWANRPARCWADQVEQTMVTGAPSSGECQLSQTVDATSIVLGVAPASGALVTLSYYPLIQGMEAEAVEDMNGFNSATLSLSFRERIPVRTYG